MHLFWYGENSDPTAIAEAAGGSSLDHKMLVLIRRLIGFGHVGRVLALSWLTIRMRPFAPISLILHFIQYLIVARPASRRVKAARSELEISSSRLIGRWLNCKDGSKMECR